MPSRQRPPSEVRQHFVTFYSPGTFVAEETTKPIAEWNVVVAVKMAGTVVERYGARPYAFRFTTRERGPTDLDSHETAHSSLYYLGGRVETLAEVEARADPKERILVANMRGNGWTRVIVNDNYWRWTQPLGKGDAVLDVTLPEVPGAKGR